MTMNQFTYLIIFFLGLNIFQIHGAFAAEHEQHDTNANYFSGLDHEVARIVGDFHRALQNGDESTVRLLLADDVLIFESGGVERSRHEYADHHMQADIAFLQHMQVTKLEHHIKVNGETAVSISRSKIQGRYKDKDIDVESMETLLLMKVEGKWQIIHVHWSN